MSEGSIVFLGNKETNLQAVLQDLTQKLDDKMRDLLPEPDERKESKLFEAMRYSTLSEGKRLRPLLTVLSADLFGVSKSSALQAAAAIEFIHVYSLIHDDLPAMDNDDMRRGQPSCHKKFDEATAILAGDALLTLAFEILADPSTHASAQIRCDLIKTVGVACGCRGMVGGQILDLLSEKETFAVNDIIRLQRMKTGALFATSCEAGAILGNAAPNLRNALRGYAHDLGLAFQITDDLLDVKGPSKGSGKVVHEEKETLVSAMGFEKAKEQAKVLIHQAVSHLAPFQDRANILRDLANFLIDRQR